MVEANKTQPMQPDFPPPMLVANVLSDLTSLRLCDAKAAKEFTSLRPGDVQPQQSPDGSISGSDQAQQASPEDPDLRRAQDLVRLTEFVRLASVASPASSPQPAKGLPANKPGAIAQQLLDQREAVLKALASVGITDVDLSSSPSQHSDSAAAAAADQHDANSEWENWNDPAAKDDEEDTSAWA